MILLRNLIIIAANPFRDTNYQSAKSIYTMLSEAGHECCISPVFSDDFENPALSGFSVRKIEDAAHQARLVIVLGGDGTILYAADQLRDAELPIAGVNLGGKGFLTAMEASETERLLRIAAGDYTPSRRMMLDVTLIRNQETIFQQSVLNDVVVHGANAECIGILAKCNDNPMTHFSGDGIIVTTPTGSTAYSMSAGGPIVEPDNENIIVTPICPHTMAAKSYVLLPTRTVVIEPERIHDRRAILSVDGNEAIPLVSGDQICVKRSERSVLLAETGASSFFDRAFEKLSGYGE